MNPLIQLKKTIPLFLVALACFALLPLTRAVSPPPDGGYSNANTAEGQDALFSLTTGTNNSAVGSLALYNNTTGSYNTAVGEGAMEFNTEGSANTASGLGALFRNTTGTDNTATGENALGANNTGFDNTATGEDALGGNTSGSSNTAMGAPDSTWGFRPEHLLNAAILQLDPSKISSLPLNVQTEGIPSPYNPFAANAPLKIYASGVRVASGEPGNRLDVHG